MGARIAKLALILGQHGACLLTADALLFSAAPHCKAQQATGKDRLTTGPADLKDENRTELVIAMAQRNPVTTKAPLGTKEEFDVFVERDVPVEMRDGTKLAADVYRPAQSGRSVDDKFPVIGVCT